MAEYVGRYETRIATVELTMNESGLLARVIPKRAFPTKDSPPRPAPPPTRVAFFADDANVAFDPQWTVAALSIYETEMVRSPGFAGVVGLRPARSRNYDSIGCLSHEGKS